MVGDINTGSLHLKTYDKLVVKNAKNMCLACILAIDKTTACDTGGSGGCLTVEPIMISYYGLSHEPPHQKAT
jgi:hypothetical protein